MSDFKDQMILAYERGWCGYHESYDYVRERMADAADLQRKAAKENAVDSDDREGWATDAERDAGEFQRKPGVYGEWCRDPAACIPLGRCPKNPTCGD